MRDGETSDQVFRKMDFSALLILNSLHLQEFESRSCIRLDLHFRKKKIKFQ